MKQNRVTGKPSETEFAAPLTVIEICTGLAMNRVALCRRNIAETGLKAGSLTL